MVIAGIAIAAATRKKRRKWDVGRALVRARLSSVSCNETTGLAVFVLGSLG